MNAIRSWGWLFLALWACQLQSAHGEHWSYRQLVPPALPPCKTHDWSHGALDRFVLSALERAGLQPSPDAAPEVLVRRLYFDLLGLPPTPSEADHFVARTSSAGIDLAVEETVDLLLGSHKFGERWGRHWLDVARFAESSGKEANISFPYAWRYRDYVIDCWNRDVAFDRFVLEQIAGDLLPYANDRERARQLIATGFLALGPKNLDEGNGLQFLADLVDEQIDSITRAVMASSIACARCHDHKTDPYTMEDYYGLAGIFASTKTYFGTMVSPANRVGGDPLALPAGAKLPVLHAGIPAAKVKELGGELASLRKEQTDGMAAVQRAISQGKDASEIFTLRDALRIFWRSGGIEGQLEKVDANGQPLTLAMGVMDREKVIDVPLLESGDISQPGQIVARKLPQVFDAAGARELTANQSGRIELAKWLTSAKNPLTSRVLANRVWQKLMGVGIVETVDDFGITGQPPSHPELLDHLATRLLQSDWQVKFLVREIVLSRSYRQSSEFNRQAFQIDPDNRLHWRAPKKRLDAEAIRDAMLVAVGDMDHAQPVGSLVGKIIGDRPISLIGLDDRIPKDLDGARHRSVYLPVLRDRLPDALEVFDFAEPSLVIGARDTTNVPVQALYLLNGQFMLDRASAFALRLQREFSMPEDQVQYAFRACFGRRPDAVELAGSLNFLAQDSATQGATRLALFCQALLATAEFRNLD